MKKTIHRLRKKDKHEKDRIAFIGALVITTFIVLFWLASFSIGGSPTTTSQQMANTSGPIDVIVDSFANVFDRSRK